jgi:DNA-directed RNA polymerase specialized sigma24 family protein
MTYENKIDLLESYREHTMHLYGLAQEAEQWRSIAKSTATNSDGMPRGSDTGQKVQNAAIKAADIVAQINSEIEDAKIKREAVREFIKTSLNPRYRLLLEMHYINGLSVADIAAQNDKGEKWIREMLKKAVNAIK